MTDFVYYLLYSLRISSQPGRIMLPKWLKVNEEIFNEIMSIVTKAKNQGLTAYVDGREITLDDTERLLKGLGNGKIDGRDYKKGKTILLRM